MDCSSHLDVLYSCWTRLYSWTSPIMQNHIEKNIRRENQITYYYNYYYLAVVASKKEWCAEWILQYLPKDENFNAHTQQSPNYLNDLLNSSTGFHFGLLGF